MSEVLLDVRDLKTHFPVRQGFLRRQVGTVKAVDGVSFQVHGGEVLGLVGESGCGKSTLARTIVRLVQPTSGAVLFEDQDLTEVSTRALRRLRPRLQMIFQDPYASLNPRRTVYDTLAEPLLTHSIVPRREVAGEVAGLMEKVGLASRFSRKYPHEFSGGQRQRIAIARALALRPVLMIADEPVSALDVSVQAQILNLLQELSRTEQLAMILISHDLGVVKHMADRIGVMYLGKLVEIGPAASVFHHPQHPYTRALLSAIPLPDPRRERARLRMALKGDPPSPINPPEGCPFHPRCPFSAEECTQVVPPLIERNPGQQAACIRLEYVEKVTREKAV